MDFLEGQSLADVIKSENHIGQRRAAAIFIQACDALEHAHQKGVLHRDLKSSNIMLVDYDSNPDFVKVVDFGIAKLMPNSGKQQQNLTATGEIFGSPIYMSPEQCLGLTLDARSDIYSMGTMLYEALTGQPPLLGANIIDTMQMHVESVPPRPSKIRADLHISGPLEMICVRSLEKKPENRFKSMGEFRDALLAIVPLLPPEAGQPNRQFKTGTRQNIPVIGRQNATGAQLGSATGTAGGPTNMNHNNSVNAHNPGVHNIQAGTRDFPGGVGEVGEQKGIAGGAAQSGYATNNLNPETRPDRFAPPSQGLTPLMQPNQNPNVSGQMAGASGQSWNGQTQMPGQVPGHIQGQMPGPQPGQSSPQPAYFQQSNQPPQQAPISPQTAPNFQPQYSQQSQQQSPNPPQFPVPLPGQQPHFNQNQTSNPTANPDFSQAQNQFSQGQSVQIPFGSQQQFQIGNQQGPSSAGLSNQNFQMQTGQQGLPFSGGNNSGAGVANNNFAQSQTSGMGQPGQSGNNISYSSDSKTPTGWPVLQPESNSERTQPSGATSSGSPNFQHQAFTGSQQSTEQARSMQGQTGAGSPVNFPQQSMTSSQSQYLQQSATGTRPQHLMAANSPEILTTGAHAAARGPEIVAGDDSLFGNPSLYGEKTADETLQFQTQYERNKMANKNVPSQAIRHVPDHLPSKRINSDYSDLLEAGDKKSKKGGSSAAHAPKRLIYAPELPANKTGLIVMIVLGSLSVIVVIAVVCYVLLTAVRPASS
jgi:serine/threonine protein kinase